MLWGMSGSAFKVMRELNNGDVHRRGWIGGLSHLETASTGGLQLREPVVNFSFHDHIVPINSLWAVQCELSFILRLFYHSRVEMIQIRYNHMYYRGNDGCRMVAWTNLPFCDISLMIRIGLQTIK